MQFGRGRVRPEIASLRVYPTWVADRARQFRVAAIVGLAFPNPRVDVLLGGRVTAELHAFAPFGIGLHGAAEAAYGTSDRTTLALALIADLGNVIQVVGRGTRDMTHRTTAVSLGLGTHLENLFHSRVGSSVATSPPPVRSLGSGYLGEVAVLARNAMSSAFGAALESDADAKQRNDEKRAAGDYSAPEPTDRCVGIVRLAPALIDAIAAEGTVATVRARLAAGVFARADTVFHSHQALLDHQPPGVSEREMVGAMVMGFRAALKP